MNSTTPRSLDERLDMHAEAWQPDPGDKLIGEVIDVDTRETEYGVYPIVTVRTDEGDELAIHGYHTVLKREFSKARPGVGERIGVKYLGKHERGYEAYKVVREKPVASAPVDWDKMGAEAEAAAAEAETPADEPAPVDEADSIPRFAPPDVDDDIPF